MLDFLRSVPDDAPFWFREKLGGRMEFIVYPWPILTLSSWINQEQVKAIEYLMTENEILREKLAKGRIVMNDDQRQRIAVKGKILKELDRR